MTENKKVFQQNLLNMLAKYNKTQKEVADAIHVSPQTFNTWCQGIAIPRMGKIQLLADYFHINMSDLIEKQHPITDEDALFDVQISEDEELKEVMKKYYALDDQKKKHVIDLINLLSEE